MLNRLLLSIFLALFTGSANAQNPQQPLTIHLWPQGAPGARNASTPEVDLTTASDNLVGGRRVTRLTGVSDPTLSIYLAPRDKDTGATVIVAPGGSYKLLAYDLEGTEVCEWLNQLGISCAVLKYRVPFPPGVPQWEAALQDAQRAMALLRTHAQNKDAGWPSNPNRIGMLGFSAGAHLTAAASTRFTQRSYPAQNDSSDNAPLRPDFAVLIYPAFLTANDQFQTLAPELTVSASTPTTFLLQTEDDPLGVENSLIYYQVLKHAKVPAEMHLYSEGRHGYGLRPGPLPVNEWPKLVEAWLRHNGLIR
jgi:acetyl esterase/lipase